MKPPETIPTNLLNEFTMDGKIQLIYQYNDATSPEATEEINSKFNLDELSNSILRILKSETNYYGQTDTWLYQALDVFQIFNKNVALIGSTYPWYEALLMTRCPKSITIIEYSDRKLDGVGLNYIKPHEVDEWVEKNGKFDAVFSISSYEHDGLGRYGDPLDPNGDLKAMKQLKKYLQKDGVLFLSVPIGKDKLYFNLHRVYGQYRFPLLVEGWELIGYNGFHNPTSFNIDNEGMYQPIFILKNSQ